MAGLVSQMITVDKIPVFLGDTVDPKVGGDGISIDIAGVRYGKNATDHITYGHPTYPDMSHMALATNMDVFQDFLTAMGLPQ